MQEAADYALALSDGGSTTHVPSEDLTGGA
jgi:hypothetical protein